MFTDNSLFVSLDDAFAEMTELAEQRDYNKMMWDRASEALRLTRESMETFVRENHGATDAPALIEALCEEFGLDMTRRVTATVNVTYTVYVDAPFTKTIDEVEQDIADLEFHAIYNGSDYDFFDSCVEDATVDYIDED